MPPHLALGASRQAVLLCYPGVQEYNLSHWAFRRLANLLTKAGFPVFRFDYFGTGDSAGALEEASIESWVDNIASAAQEALDLSGCRKLSLVGMRLGAALAARACGKGLELQDLVLWDPVVNGRAYIAELSALEERMSLALLHGPQKAVGAPVLCGYPFPRDLRTSLATLDLQLDLPTHARRVTLVGSEEKPAYRELQNAWSNKQLELCIRLAKQPTTAGSSQKQMLSNEALQVIVEQISGRSDG